jgi:hypothetical protein
LAGFGATCLVGPVGTLAGVGRVAGLGGVSLVTPGLAGCGAGVELRGAADVAGAGDAGATGAGDEGWEAAGGCEADVAPPPAGSGATCGTGAGSGDGAAAHVGAAAPASSATSVPVKSADRPRPPGEASRRTDGEDWLWRFRYPLPGDASGADGQ